MLLFCALLLMRLQNAETDHKIIIQALLPQCQVMSRHIFHTAEKMLRVERFITGIAHTRRVCQGGVLASGMYSSTGMIPESQFGEAMASSSGRVMIRPSTSAAPWSFAIDVNAAHTGLRRAGFSRTDMQVWKAHRACSGRGNPIRGMWAKKRWAIGMSVQ